MRGCFSSTIVGRLGLFQLIHVTKWRQAGRAAKLTLATQVMSILWVHERQKKFSVNLHTMWETLCPKCAELSQDGGDLWKIIRDIQSELLPRTTTQRKSAYARRKKYTSLKKSPWTIFGDLQRHCTIASSQGDHTQHDFKTLSKWKSLVNWS